MQLWTKRIIDKEIECRRWRSLERGISSYVESKEQQSRIRDRVSRDLLANKSSLLLPWKYQIRNISAMGMEVPTGQGHTPKRLMQYIEALSLVFAEIDIA